MTRKRLADTVVFTTVILTIALGPVVPFATPAPGLAGTNDRVA